jgi:uncharacterized protein YbcC (UPF0753/DUF2309 family)
MHGTMTPAEAAVATVQQQIADVCRRIAPVWDLDNFVAVNPFLGMVDRPLAQAAHLMRCGIDAAVLPTLAYFRERWHAGAFDLADVQRAARRAGLDAAPVLARLRDEPAAAQRMVWRIISAAEAVDRRDGTAWQRQVLRQATTWCAASLPPDAPAWGRPATMRGLYASWRDAAALDRSFDLYGLAGWRAAVAAAPDTADAAIAAGLAALPLAPTDRPAYLYRLLAGVYGWAAWLRRAGWPDDAADGPLRELLALRVVGDVALAQACGGVAAHQLGEALDDDELEARLILQDALEDHYLDGMRGAFTQDAGAAQPAVQALFCIDVRSEVLRRHLEACSPTIETRGFAGFFGVALGWHSAGGVSARCPVLLDPALTLTGAPRLRLPLAAIAKRLTTAPATAYTFVESLGIGYALNLVADALGITHEAADDDTTAPFSLDGMPLEQRVATAAAILRNTGLGDRTSRIVLLVGHGGRSENNAHRAGLECGACGGHSGALNARVAAALLNDPAVRAGLAAAGLALPATTRFVAALHQTSDDTVRVLDRQQIPAASHADLAGLERWLDAAGAAARAERAPTLGLAPQAGPWLPRMLRRRARDWSEPRPEWGLARNAAFIAARRSRTRGADLGGRAFLHDYDWRQDADGAVLGLIVSAPLVVASWINLQYFGSTVDPERFGAGTKPLHNRIGATGVLLGNGGDLRIGLAQQSVVAPDGSWYHEPLRLQVIIEAPTSHIDDVLARHTAPALLVRHGWVRLFALDPAHNRLRRHVPERGWEDVPGAHPAMDALSH